MNCKSYQTEIEELSGATELSAETARHLNDCLGCKKFKTERERLAALLVCLERVNAPENFEFGVRAKLKAAPALENTNSGWNKWIYAAPASAFAVLALILANNYVNQSPHTATQSVSIPQTAATPETAAVKPAQTPELVKPSETTAPSFTESTQTVAFNSPSPNNAPRIARTAPRKNVRKPAREEIISRDSRTLGVREGRILLNPNNIPLNQPVATPLSSAKNLLTFHGIETANENGSLRVTSVKTKTPAEAAGIKIGDLIESINGQPPTNLNSPLLDRVKIRRDGTTREIKLLPKP